MKLRITVALFAALSTPVGAAETKKADKPIIKKPFLPLEAAKTRRVPKGFNVTLFAAEPDIKQPIGFRIDDRGRLWVAEAARVGGCHGLHYDAQVRRRDWVD